MDKIKSRLKIGTIVHPSEHYWVARLISDKKEFENSNVDFKLLNPSFQVKANLVPVFTHTGTLLTINLVNSKKHWLSTVGLAQLCNFTMHDVKAANQDD